MLDRFDKPAFWSVFADDFEAFLKADAGVIAILTKDVGGVSLVDVAQGVTPALPAPCVRLCRGSEGKQPLTTYQWDAIPASFEFDLACCAQVTGPRDPQLSAKSSWDALGAMEAAVLAAARRYFDPMRDIASILGAPFQASVKGIEPTDGSYWPVVGSTITIQLNKV